MPDAMTIWLIAIIAVIVLLLILLLVVGGRSRKAARREHEQHQRDSQLASTEEHRPSSGPWSDSAQRGSGATGAAAGAVAPAAFAGSSALTHRTDAAGTGVSVDEADAGQQVQSGTQAGAAADSERQGTFPSVLNTAEGADTQGDKSGAVAPGVAGGTGVAVDQVAEQDRVTSDDAATASDA
ncbi:MAG: hypothetical protein Q4G34_06090, partial [Micrococcus sp.]|nr:hypothetical protein [Micrococcus sp.]